MKFFTIYLCNFRSILDLIFRSFVILFSLRSLWTESGCICVSWTEKKQNWLPLTYILCRYGYVYFLICKVSRANSTLHNSLSSDIKCWFIRAIFCLVIWPNNEATFLCCEWYVNHCAWEKKVWCIDLYLWRIDAYNNLLSKSSNKSQSIPLLCNAMQNQS